MLSKEFDNIETLKQIFENIDESIIIANQNDEIAYVNKSFCKTYLYELNEIVGKNIKVLHSDNQPSEAQTPTDNQQNSIPTDRKFINKKKNGSEFFVEYKSFPIKNKSETATVYIIKDISSDTKTEESIKSIQDKYRNLFIELKDAIYESTPDGKLLELNPSGYELLGIDPNYPLAKIDIANELYVHKEDRERFKQKLERDGYVKNYEINIKKKNGEIVTVLETAMAVKDQNGKIISYRGILRDITDAKKSEMQLKNLINKLAAVNEQLKESEQELKNSNASKDKFFSIIAHDLRSPFSSILSFSEFLTEDIEELSKEEIVSFANKIHEAAKNVFNLLENLLQWSRIQSGKIQFEPINFNMSHKAEEVIRLMQNNADSKNISIINDISNDSIVFADEDMIFSVLQNLLSNAIKFTRPGGTVRLTSEVKEKTIEFSIIDNGVGIKEDDIGKLFRLDVNHSTYGTNDEKGSGLGLILCKEMIEKNKGKIWVKSLVNSGTTFTFSLPRS
ncbi:PAS domain S-box protein [Melioribacteraceae bacterium 4301-Me]|uniref:sensor histidine kinase n=1 Tax=Pyranulibacter aquaticus TaxID=3163344 RepID=UPI003597B6B0